MKSKTNRTSKSISKESKHIEQLKVDLLSLISHELRTPLTSILNAVRLLQSENLENDQKKIFLSIAQKNAEKLNLTLNQLLDLSKIGSGRLICRLHEADLNLLLKPQVQSLLTHAKQKKIIVQTNINPRLPIIIADAPRLEHSIHALIDNALKYCSPGGQVRIKVAYNKLKKKIYLKFSNTVSPLRLKKLPKDLLFYQAEPILSRSLEGLGGSLVIVQEIIRQHSGQFNVQVVRTPKATFIVELELPVVTGEAAVLQVLESRMFGLRNEIGALSLLLIQGFIKSQEKQIFSQTIKANLFRASDVVYDLNNELVVVLGDCKKADAPKLVHRLLNGLEAATTKNQLKEITVGLAHFPDDALNNHDLIEYARAHQVQFKDFFKKNNKI